MPPWAMNAEPRLSATEIPLRIQLKIGAWDLIYFQWL